MISRKMYRWFYDHVHSRYYDGLMRWCFLPFGGERRCRQRLLSAVRWPAGERILELCCGTGGTTRSIVAAAGRRSPSGHQENFVVPCTLFGLDLSAELLRHAARKRDLAYVILVVGDAARVCFPAESFDKVIITHALHEMMHAQRLRVLGEAYRLLRDGGDVVILELDRPAGWLWRQFVALWWFYWLPFNFETPTRRDMIKIGLTNEVAATGFQQVRKTSYGRGALQTVRGRKGPIAPVSVH
jgi:demethylmenaquinone methyltransferase/2-methoxy-6-polyprenyl-1,4-benzoquinol methylase